MLNILPEFERQTALIPYHKKACEMAIFRNKSAILELFEGFKIWIHVERLFTILERNKGVHKIY